MQEYVEQFLYCAFYWYRAYAALAHSSLHNSNSFVVHFWPVSGICNIQHTAQNRHKTKLYGHSTMQEYVEQFLYCAFDQY